MTTRTIIRGGRLLTMAEGEAGAVVSEGTLVLAGDRIEYIGPGDVEARPEDEIVDGRGKLYMPGLVNTHGHAAMSLLRGLKDDVNLQVWLQEYMWPTEAKYTAADVRAGTELSIVEMLKSGTTTFMDMYDHMDQVAEAVEASGMRACLNRGVIGLCPEEVQRAKLEEAIRFARAWNGAADGRITTTMAPHAPYTCPPEYIAKFVEAAHELDLPIHTHMSETAREVEENAAAYGVRPVEHLRRLGVFSRPCLVAHGVHLTDEEIDILASHGVGVSHNPGSNLKLASGVARVPALRKAGVRVSLGTDSAASNNNLDIFREIRLAALIHKGVSGDPTAVPAAEALRMGTVEGARSLWLNDVGTLEAGMKADVIAVDVTGPHYQPEADLVSHLVYAGSGADVSDVWVNGKQLVRGRVCLTLDEERVYAEANAALRRLRG
ncbi:amidohydrolase [Paenibacillus sp.]|uniref:amidohydrolase n=1 Tax=Paenibacillus sp. TaxID=58172 RepID=UPI002D5240EA|nr:amidohydrolase [Paenibacillus sp.]HZG55087.1 amidohydrolase [Paenibacillus sp.]